MMQVPQTFTHMKLAQCALRFCYLLTLDSYYILFQIRVVVVAFYFKYFLRPCLAKMFTTPKPCNFLIHSRSFVAIHNEKNILLRKVQQATLLLSALFSKRKKNIKKLPRSSAAPYANMIYFWN